MIKCKHFFWLQYTHHSYIHLTAASWGHHPFAFSNNDTAKARKPATVMSLLLTEPTARLGCPPENQGKWHGRSGPECFSLTLTKSRKIFWLQLLFVSKVYCPGHSVGWGAQWGQLLKLCAQDFTVLHEAKPKNKFGIWKNRTQCFLIRDSKGAVAGCKVCRKAAPQCKCLALKLPHTGKKHKSRMNKTKPTSGKASAGFGQSRPKDGLEMNQTWARSTSTAGHNIKCPTNTS